MTGKALKGVRILEYCETISGSYCAKLMADLGAEVIKIEKPRTGDGSRRKPPFKDDDSHPEKSILFLYVNTNKYGITLDPADENGKKIFHQLVEKADILIDDHHPGYMESLGLGYDHLHRIHPGLIMASITPFGLSGPYKDFKAFQLNVSHVSGQGNLLPMPALNKERPPVKVGGNSGNFDPGLLASIAVMGALFQKSRTGKGQFIELSKMEALICMQRVESVTFPNDQVNMLRVGNENRRSPEGILPCKDGYVVVVAPEEHQWKSFMKLIGDPAWAKEEWCKDRVTRSQHADEIGKRVLEWTMKHTKEEIFRKGQALSVPVAPINSPEDVVNSPQFNARKFFVETDHPVMGPIPKFPAGPYQLSATPWALDRPAPGLGEHNEMIFGKQLGYSREALEKLSLTGAI
ncbi:MAG: CoA transferase [Desulfobacteraceae bacterium]|nr:CoA transferase [Desulfobacteraceae bacterium]